MYLTMFALPSLPKWTQYIIYLAPLRGGITTITSFMYAMKTLHSRVRSIWRISGMVSCHTLINVCVIASSDSSSTYECDESRDYTESLELPTEVVELFVHYSVSSLFFTNVSRIPLMLRISKTAMVLPIVLHYLYLINLPLSLSMFVLLNL